MVVVNTIVVVERVGLETGTTVVLVVVTGDPLELVVVYTVVEVEELETETGTAVVLVVTIVDP